MKREIPPDIMRRIVAAAPVLYRLVKSQAGYGTMFWKGITWDRWFSSAEKVLKQIDPNRLRGEEDIKKQLAIHKRYQRRQAKTRCDAVMRLSHEVNVRCSLLHNHAGEHQHKDILFDKIIFKWPQEPAQ